MACKPWPPYLLIFTLFSIKPCVMPLKKDHVIYISYSPSLTLLCPHDKAYLACNYHDDMEDALTIFGTLLLIFSPFLLITKSISSLPKRSLFLLNYIGDKDSDHDSEVWKGVTLNMKRLF